MSKVTSQGWPEPTEWAKRLHHRLELLGAHYISTPWTAADDPEAFTGLNLKQARSAEIVLVVVSALRELPMFEKSTGLAALHDVAGAMNDVVLGGSPRLFASVRPGTRGGDGIDRHYLMIFVVLAVRFLVEAHGWKESPARKVVTEIFAGAGATGRKGNSLSPSTVQAWCERAAPLATNHYDRHIHSEAERMMAEFRADPRWPGSGDEIIAWIRRMASHPLLASKYG